MAPYLSNTEHPGETLPDVSAPAKPSLYILSDFHPEAVKHARELFDCVLYGDPRGDDWRKNATAILIKDYYITDADLEAAPQLKVIGKQGVGLDKIDLEACKRHGVAVCNSPGINAGAVAEMTLCLAFNVAREVTDLIMRQRVKGEAIRKETVNGVLLSGKVLGIVGMGHIGSPWDHIPHQRVDSLEEILDKADIVTLHLPLSANTRGMISAPQLKRMKSSAILLNTARGGLVDEEALTEALEQGRIWGAGFDCHEQEPPTLEKYQRLWNCPRFVGTPHIAAATDETQIATINAATDKVYKFMTSK
ncbi:hypothetical protein NLU13_3068 [Sarocladium strictum]|uniref:D-3-phosphoglycerate dehydrogenase n=1 Tax=Sarocladium strictum TaxID=5046 RepID=A0AA39L9Y6_SARSR|nr:hypothetical protein NLU13_3068 [Sarocladium strictum]